MKIAFCRRMMQRYRAVLHLVDPIIASGHDLYVIVNNNYKSRSSYDLPLDVSGSSSKSLRMLANNFGIEMRHFDQLKFSTDKSEKADLYLTLDETKHPSSSYLGIPYVGHHCYSHGNKHVVGNPMCDLIRNSCSHVSEIPNSVLIIHPGGARGFVSPPRKSFSKKQVTENNIALIESVIRGLRVLDQPQVTIKSHPVPYKYCDVRSLTDLVVPNLSMPCKVKNNDLATLIAQHEFIINFGSSTTLWVMGSKKKWINIQGQAKFSYAYHRDHRSRAPRWEEWPQNVTTEEMPMLILGYDNCVQSSKVSRLMNGYKQLFAMNATDNIMRKIDGE